MADPKGLSMEQWKQVVCNDRYEVSNQGRIRRAVCGKATRPGRILKPKSAKGMLFILLSTLLIFVVSYRDRRAQRHLVEELTHSTSLLQQTQRHAGLGSWEYGTCFIWTPEALALLGHAQDEELDNRQCSLERLLSWLHPADRPAAQRALQALLLERKPMTLSARPHQPHKLQATWLLL